MVTETFCDRCGEVAGYSKGSLAGIMKVADETHTSYDLCPTCTDSIVHWIRENPKSLGDDNNGD